MPSYGYSLMCELYDPNELLAQAARAETAGFDFLTISDHFHPWLFSHHHSLKGVKTGSSLRLRLCSTRAGGRRGGRGGGRRRRAVA
jgi:alkanesulfonate monooxygenase SsuD/methylene tetrahydromethanopterin reductase-like flavin-dependent oxidoreductase (luciferase family)